MMFSYFFMINPLWVKGENFLLLCCTILGVVTVMMFMK